MNTSPATSSHRGNSRRDFLKTTAAAAAALAATPLMAPRLYGEPASAPIGAAGTGDRIAVGFVGHGSQGMSLLRAAKRLGPDKNVTVAAVCDLWEKRLMAARQTAELPEASSYRDYRRMLERKDIDAVVVATPTHTHAQIAIDAMEAGKHVYIEKPTTRYLREAFDVYDTARRTGRTLQVGMQGCSHPRWRRAAEVIQAGGLGPLVLAQGSYMRNSGSKGEWNVPIDQELTEGSVDWKEWLGPVGDQPFSADTFFRWRKYYPYSPGILGELLPHRVGAILLGTGKVEFPRRVVCLGTRKLQTDRDIPDNTQVLAEFPSGLTLLLIGSTVTEQGLPEVIRGHHATMAIGGNRLQITPERPFADEIDPQVIDDLHSDNDLRAHQENWYDCIRSGAEPWAGPELSIRLDTILNLAEISERLNVMCLFDETTRAVTTADGQPVNLLDYDHSRLT